MLGQILNELAQVETWMTGLTDGHESHDPATCPHAELWQQTAPIRDDSIDDVVTVVVFAMVELLRRTKDPARVGLLIVDRVRSLCAQMARHRINQSRKRARGEFLRGATNIDRAYNTPN